MKSWKTIVWIFVCIGLAAPKDWLMQFGKIPALIQHFQYHNQANPAIDFLSYLVLHYTDKEHLAKEHPQEHDNLPFSHHHSSGCFQLIALAEIPKRMLLYVPTVALVKTLIDQEQTFLYASFYASIWQPPKTIG